MMPQGGRTTTSVIPAFAGMTGMEKSASSFNGLMAPDRVERRMHP